MNILHLIPLAIVSVCASTHAEPSNDESGSRWLDTSQLLTIEIPSASTAISDLKRTELLSHPRWNELLQFLQHEKYGIWTEDQWQVWLDIVEQIEIHLKPGNVVFSVGPGNKPESDWQLIVRSESNDPAQSFQKILTLISKLKSETDDDSDEAEIVEIPMPDDNVTELTIPGLPGKSIYYYVQDKWIVIAANRIGAEKTLRRMSGRESEYRELRASRIYQSLSHELNLSKNDGASIIVHMDPRLVWTMTGMFNQEQIRIWGLNELVGAGMSVNFVPSSTKNDRMDIVICSFVKSTAPRTGIADAVHLKGMPDQFPPLPEGIALFGMVNVDWQHLDEEKQRLHDVENGKGSFVKAWENENRINRLLGNSYREDWRTAAGNVRCRCWYIEDSTLKTSEYVEMKDPEKQIQCLLKLTETGAGMFENFGYEEELISGYRALLTKPGSSPVRYGSLYKGKWQINGDETLLRRMAEQEDGNSIPAEVDRMVRSIQRHAGIEDNNSIVVAVWPPAWDSITTGLANAAIVRSIQQRFDTEKPATKDAYKRFQEESGELRKNLLSFKFREPTTKTECLHFAHLLSMKIASDSFGKFVLVGGDNGKGLKLFAMSFPVETMNDIEGTQGEGPRP